MEGERGTWSFAGCLLNMKSMGFAKGLGRRKERKRGLQISNLAGL